MAAQKYKYNNVPIGGEIEDEDDDRKHYKKKELVYICCGVNIAISVLVMLFLVLYNFDYIHFRLLNDTNVNPAVSTTTTITPDASNNYGFSNNAYLHHQKKKNVCKNGKVYYSKQDAKEELNIIRRKKRGLFTSLDVDDDNQLSFDEFKQFISISYDIGDKFDALNGLYSEDKNHLDNILSVTEMVDLALHSCGSGSISPGSSFICSTFKELENELCTTNNDFTQRECYEMISYYLLYAMIGDNAIDNGFVTKQEFIEAISMDIYNNLDLNDNDKISFKEFKASENENADYSQVQIDMMQKTMNNQQETVEFNVGSNDKIMLTDTWSKQEIKQFIQSDIENASKNGRKLLGDCSIASGFKCFFTGLICWGSCVCASAPTPAAPGCMALCLGCIGYFVADCGESVFNCAKDSGWLAGNGGESCNDAVQACIYSSNNFDCLDCLSRAIDQNEANCHWGCFCDGDEVWGC